MFFRFLIFFDEKKFTGLILVLENRDYSTLKTAHLT